MADIGTGAVTGAAEGAAVGSIVPGVGNVVGGIIGGALGLFGGIQQNQAAAQSISDQEKFQ